MFTNVIKSNLEMDIRGIKVVIRWFISQNISP